MALGKLKWMRQALKRIGHGAAVGQDQFVSRLRSQSGFTPSGISSLTHTSSPVCQYRVVLTFGPFQVTPDVMGSVQEWKTILDF